MEIFRPIEIHKGDSTAAPCQEQPKARRCSLRVGTGKAWLSEDSAERSQPVASTLSPQPWWLCHHPQSLSVLSCKGILLILPDVKTYNKATVIKAVWD